MKYFFSLLCFVCFVSLFAVGDFYGGYCDECGMSVSDHYVCQGCSHVCCYMLENQGCRYCGRDPGSSPTWYTGSGLDNNGNGTPNGNSDPADNPMIVRQETRNGITITQYSDGSISVSASSGSDSHDLSPGSSVTFTSYENGTTVVSGIDSDGNLFTTTYLSDGTSFDGTNPAFLDSPSSSTTLNVPVTSDTPYQWPESDPDPGSGYDPNPIPDDPDPGSGDNPSDPLSGDDPDDPDPGSGQGGSGEGGSGEGGSGDDGPGEGGSGGGSGGGSSTHLPNDSGFDPASRSFSSSALNQISQKLCPNFSLSGSGSSDLTLHIPLTIPQMFGGGDFSFDIGPFSTACNGALVPVMSFTRALSIFSFALIFLFGVVRSLRQW